MKNITALFLSLFAFLVFSTSAVAADEVVVEEGILVNIVAAGSGTTLDLSGPFAPIVTAINVFRDVASASQRNIKISYITVRKGFFGGEKCHVRFVDVPYQEHLLSVSVPAVVQVDQKTGAVEVKKGEDGLPLTMPENYRCADQVAHSLGYYKR